MEEWPTKAVVQCIACRHQHVKCCVRFYRVIFVSSWSEGRSCRERSSQDRAACEVLSPYEPSHSSAPARPCPERATNNTTNSIGPSRTGRRVTLSNDTHIISTDKSVCTSQHSQVTTTSTWLMTTSTWLWLQKASINKVITKLHQWSFLYEFINLGFLLLQQNHQYSVLSVNKSSAVAEMGDRGHNRHMGRKPAGCCAPFGLSRSIYLWVLLPELNDWMIDIKQKALSRIFVTQDLRCRRFSV